MPLSVKANLLDDGVVDTLGSFGATSGVHTCVSNARTACDSLAQYIAILFFEKLVNKHV
jgi:hypothetical protein